MEYITKKQLLEEMNISYGQLYRWKRIGLIPESWFIKRPSSTGQETILPRKKITARIKDIQRRMEQHSLEQLVEKYSYNCEKQVITLENLYKSRYLTAEYVNAVGNYFKKTAYTAAEYMLIICCADIASKEKFTTRQYVDLLRYALPLAARCTKPEIRCVFFAAGGDCHVVIVDNTAEFSTDNGLRIMGNYNLEIMWNKLKEEV